MTAGPGKPALRPGDWVTYDDGYHQVVALAGTSVRLRPATGAESVVAASYLMAAPDFAVTGTEPLPAVEPSGLLATLPESVREAAREWERHMMEIETGLPPGTALGTPPRPGYDPAAFSLMVPGRHPGGHAPAAPPPARNAARPERVPLPPLRRLDRQPVTAHPRRRRARQRHDKSALWFNRTRRNAGRNLFFHNHVKAVLTRAWTPAYEKFEGVIWHSAHVDEQMKTDTAPERQQAHAGSRSPFRPRLQASGGPSTLPHR
ncbi:hypothetical protein [Streptomyces sp. NPDC006510]|uniref:hypothetical protein n=1 Tax=Streptomyces sp. NPDC006510 TaxID=3155600 RepID=UPI0033BDDA2E